MVNMTADTLCIPTQTEQKKQAVITTSRHLPITASASQHLQLNKQSVVKGAASSQPAPVTGSFNGEQPVVNGGSQLISQSLIVGGTSSPFLKKQLVAKSTLQQQTLRDSPTRNTTVVNGSGPIRDTTTTAIGISRRLNNLISKTSNINSIHNKTNSADNTQTSYHSQTTGNSQIGINNNYLDNGTHRNIGSDNNNYQQQPDRSSISMQLTYAPCHYVFTRLTLYYGSLVDLQWCRSVHSSDTCTYDNKNADSSSSSSQNINHSQNSNVNNGNIPCNAVHFGLCTAYKGGGVFVNRQPPQQKNTPTTVNSVPQKQVSPPKQQTGKKIVRAITTQNVQLSLQKDRAEGATQHHSQLTNNTDSLPKRGDPDGQSDPFLRQKEAELREKREREKGGGKKDASARSSSGDNNNTWASNSNSNNATNKNTLTVLSSSSLRDSDINNGNVTTNGANNNSRNTNSGNYSNSNISAVVNIDDRSNINSDNAKNSNKPHLHRLRTASSGNSAAQSKSPQGSKSDSPVVKHQQLSQQQRQQLVNVHIPQFYFPKGHPGEVTPTSSEEILLKIKEEFSKIDGGRAAKTDMKPVTKACGLPMYMSTVVFKVFGGEKHGHLTLQQFIAQWRKLCNNCHDNASKFVHLIAKPGCHYLEHDDFVPLIQDVVEGHPGLTFLQEAPEFHSRYVQTVISRIFYCVNRSWSGKITVNEIRRSNLVQTLKLLDDEEDINQITDFFSYEHFYVIYCKFWELDKDHDLFISKEDLARHNDHAISSKMIDRIFSGAVTKNLKDGKMSYKDFVWFLISEEDKRHFTSIEYWFRCMDLDGDGIISMYEMEYFYREQVEKMEQLGIETLPFEDTLCQMLDMLKPQVDYNVSLRDLKACKLTPIFFDTFFNLDKYLEHEQKDPFANARDLEDGEPEMSDWERYAAEEYELLVAEEGANENMDELVYEDDFEAEEEEMSAMQQQQDSIKMGDNISSKQSSNKQGGRPKAPSPEEDIYDFSNTKDLGY